MNGIKRDLPLRKTFDSDDLKKLVAGITDGKDKAVSLLMIDTGLGAEEVAGWTRIPLNSLTVRTQPDQDGRAGALRQSTFHTQMPLKKPLPEAALD